MTKTQFCMIALLFIATQAGVTFVMQQIVPHTMPPQWEYRIYYLEPHQSGAYYGSDLHALGEHGWELVSVVPRGASTQMCIFKKPIFVPMKSGSDEEPVSQSKTAGR